VTKRNQKTVRVKNWRKAQERSGKAKNLGATYRGASHDGVKRMVGGGSFLGAETDVYGARGKVQFMRARGSC